MIPFTAVVVTHNSAAELAELLDSIDSHLDPRPELIVVDALSSDDSAAVARGRARLIELGQNPGFGAAVNAGVAQARSDVTVLLNPDVVLQGAGLATLAARARGRRALLVPRLLNLDGSVQRSAHPLPGRVAALVPALVHPRALPGPLRRAADPWRSQRTRMVGWAIAACVAAPTALLRGLGPFDPDQFLFYEDMDLCLHARAQGIPTELHPDVSLVHAGAHSTRVAYAGEPLATLARRRREVVEARLGPRARARDDLAQGVTFATRAASRAVLRRPASRERAQLAALIEARRRSSQPG